MPYAGIVRVSRQGNRDDERFRSPELQRAAIDRWAEANGVVEHEPALIDVSGARVDEHETVVRVLELVERGERAGVVVAELTRLSRLSWSRAGGLVDRIERAGGRVVSASEEFGDTVSGRGFRAISFTMARMEYEHKAEQFADSKRAAVADRKALKSREPFGYAFDDAHRLVVVEAEAEVVREMFRRRAAGESLRAILAYFEGETGRRSSATTMSYMLRNRVYLGEIHYGRNGERLANLEAHEAVVELDDFNAAQRVNGERSSRTSRRPGGRPKSLLAGIVRCESCGRGLGLNVANAHTYPTPYYRCARDGRCSAGANVNADAVDELVREHVLEWAGSVADELVEAERAAGRTPRHELEQRVAEAERVLAEHEADVELELELGSDAYRAGRAARLELVERRRRELDEAGELDEAELARGTLRQALTGELELDVDALRRLLVVVVDRVVVRRPAYRGEPVRARVSIVMRDERELAS